MEMTPDELRDLCTAAVLRAGADADTARSLSEATVRAELRGRSAVAASHLVDYLGAFGSGAIDGAARPEVVRKGTVVSVDARQGTAQRAVDEALPELLAVRNSYTCGELGDYPSRLAELGLVALAAANAPAAVALGTDGAPVVGTNPFSVAALTGDRPFVVDQAISPAAYVTVRELARRGLPIPEGWAVDSEGCPTTDPDAALEGAFLPDGGHRTGNIGLVAEVLAGLAGGLWSLDAPSFTDGVECPSTGLFIIAVDPSALGQAGFADRLDRHLSRLEEEHGVHVPGRGRGYIPGTVHINDAVHRILSG